MSENSEISLRGFAAFSRGDWEACLDDVHPEIEWHVSFKLPDLPPDKDVYQGRDQVLALFEAFNAVWDELTVEVEGVLHDDRDCTLVVRVRFQGRAEGSGIVVDQRLFYVQTFEDGLLRVQRPFETEAEAFAAAGVER